MAFSLGLRNGGRRDRRTPVPGARLVAIDSDHFLMPLDPTS
jgi:hypothetical protein